MAATWGMEPPCKRLKDDNSVDLPPLTLQQLHTVVRSAQSGVTAIEVICGQTGADPRQIADTGYPWSVKTMQLPEWSLNPWEGSHVEMMPADFVQEAVDIFGPDPMAGANLEDFPQSFPPGMLQASILPPEMHKAGRWQFSAAAASKLPGTGGQDEVEGFLAKNTFDDNVVQKFRELDPDLQRMIISRGSMTSARDPNAVLMSRIALARQGKLNPPTQRPEGMAGMMMTAQGMGGCSMGGCSMGGGHSQQAPMAGDWFCPGCGDLQFARNLNCRRCNTPNPSPDPFVLEKLARQAA